MTEDDPYSHWIESRTKRVADCLVVLLFSPFLMGLIGVLALLIICIDHSCPFFCQKRVGKDGRPFKLYKLNTMGRIRGDDPSQGSQDARATAFGKWLRWTILDEIPQILINVLKGDMSLVGPRPLLQKDIILMQRRLPKDDFSLWYVTYISMRPGWTGKFGVSSRRFFIQSDDYLRARYFHDLAYRYCATPWLDVKIILLHAILPYLDINKHDS